MRQRFVKESVIVGRVFGSWIACGMLERMFTFRHDVTRKACEAPPDSQRA